MQVTYDAEVDVLYISLTNPPQPADDTVYCNKEVLLRFDEQGNAVGLTILNALRGNPTQDTAIAESDELTPGLIADYNKAGEIVGLEILNASTVDFNIREEIQMKSANRIQQIQERLAHTRPEGTGALRQDIEYLIETVEKLRAALISAGLPASLVDRIIEEG